MFWALLIGLIVGAIAKMLMPGKDPGGWIVTMLLGVAGAWIAHFVGVQLGWYAPEQPAGFVASIIGAVILLSIYRVVTRRQSLTPNQRY